MKGKNTQLLVAYKMSGQGADKDMKGSHIIKIIFIVIILNITQWGLSLTLGTWRRKY